MKSKNGAEKIIKPSRRKLRFDFRSKFSNSILRRKIFMAEKNYVVAASVESGNKNCIVVEQGAIIMATHRIVFGPDTKENCERWKRANCR